MRVLIALATLVFALLSAGDDAWNEVLAMPPDAGTAGMREQFICHWELAEFAQPGKASWNLEPWRPVVSAEEMAGSGCNPGGSDVGVSPADGARS